MTRSSGLARLAMIVCGFLLTPPLLAQTPLGTAFTYQGRLTDSAAPVTGSYDLQVKIFDALTAGGQVGSTVTLTNTTVSSGIFTVSLNFGAAAFAGSRRWLESGVRPSGTS